VLLEITNISDLTVLVLVLAMHWVEALVFLVFLCL